MGRINPAVVIGILSLELSSIRLEPPLMNGRHLFDNYPPPTGSATELKLDPEMQASSALYEPGIHSAYIDSLCAQLGRDESVVTKLGQIGSKAVPALSKMLLQPGLPDSVYTNVLAALAATESPLATTALLRASSGQVLCDSLKAQSLTILGKLAFSSLLEVTTVDSIFSKITEIAIARKSSPGVAATAINLIGSRYYWPSLISLILDDSLPSSHREKACQALWGAHFNVDELSRIEKLTSQLDPSCRLWKELDEMLVINGYRPEHPSVGDLLTKAANPDTTFKYFTDENSVTAAKSVLDLIGSGKISPSSADSAKASLAGLLEASSLPLRYREGLAKMLGSRGELWAYPYLDRCARDETNDPFLRAKSFDALLNLCSKGLALENQQEVLSLAKSLVATRPENIFESVYSLSLSAIAKSFERIQDPGFTELAWNITESSSWGPWGISSESWQDALNKLSKIDPSRVERFLVSQLRQPSNQMMLSKDAALQFLEKIDRRQAITIARQLLNGEGQNVDEWILVSALDLIERYDREEARGICRQVISHRSPNSKNYTITISAAFRTVGKLQAKEFVPDIILLLNKEVDEDVRSRAAWVLGEIGDPRALPKLLDLIDQTAIGDKLLAQEAAISVALISSRQHSLGMEVKIDPRPILKLLRVVDLTDGSAVNLILGINALNDPSISALEEKLLDQVPDGSHYALESLKLLVSQRLNKQIPSDILRSAVQRGEFLGLLHTTDDIAALQLATKAILDNEIPLDTKLTMLSIIKDSKNPAKVEILRGFQNSAYEEIQATSARYLAELGDRQARVFLRTFVTYHRFTEEALTTIFANGDRADFAWLTRLMEEAPAASYSSRQTLSSLIEDKSNYQKFVQNVRASALMTADQAEQDGLANFAWALEEAPGLGLNDPLRFKPSTFVTIVLNRKGGGGSGTQTVCIAASMDWNNAFSSLPQFWEEIAKRSHFLYFETSSDQETITLGREIKRRYVPKGARNVIMAGHSSTGQLSFSEGDPRLEAIEDSTRTLEAADQSRFRDEGFSDILMAGGNVLVIGCSAGGEDAKVPSGQAVSQVIRSIFPQAGTVFAPHLPISLGDINVRYGNQGEIEDVTFRGGTVRN